MMDEKRLFNTDEAFQFVSDPGSDSDLLGLSEDKDEDITMKDIPASIRHRKILTNVVIWEIHGFPHKFPAVRENATKPLVSGKSGKLMLIFSHDMGAIFPSNSHPKVYFIIWEMHGFSHQFPTVRENATKPMVWGKSERLVLILFP